MPPRWSDEMTVAFLELYKERENLWNQFNDLYKNKTARDTALGEIVTEMNIQGFGVTEAKAKIKALRATYNGELMKITKSETPGCGSGDVYVPTLKWFHLMKEVMDTGVLKRDTSSNLATQSENSKRKAAFTAAKAREERDDHDSGNTENQVEEDNYELDNPVVSDAEKRRERTELPPKKFKTKSRIQQIASTTREVKAVTQSTSRIGDNECDIFGKHILAQLKKLSTEQVIIAQGEIQAVLTRCRLADLYKPRNSSSVSETHSVLSYGSPSCGSPSPQVPACSPPSTARTPAMESKDSSFVDASALQYVYTDLGYQVTHKDFPSTNLKNK